MDVNDYAVLRRDRCLVGTTPALRFDDPNVVGYGMLGQMVQVFMATPIDQRHSYEINVVTPGPPRTTGMETVCAVLSAEQIVELAQRPEFKSYHFAKWPK